ncbi:MAG: hypothetical protein FJY81_04140, partial [Candidatus Aminicenantes bacterium]|nr:hypothetical protein [Candidatus Aminicenantes bacterium]
GYINWFKDYPYGYIHGDTTPYYIVAMLDYYLRSGDKEFIRRSWPSIVRAYAWCLKTDENGDGLMDNRKAGLGALEFGSLTGIQTDIYLASVWIRAAWSMEKLAGVLGEMRAARGAATDLEKALASFESRFWDEESGHYAYAFDAEGQTVKELTPWAAVPIGWGIGTPERAARTLEKICSAEVTTDWGVRILSDKSALYEPLNYNYGAVWPFLTGYAALALFEQNCPLQGYQLLAGNAGHVFDNALGHVTELYSGALHIWPQEAVAHQGFSAGGVVLPLVRGLLGLGGDASAKQVVFAPRFPADWPEVRVENFRFGEESFNFGCVRKDGRIRVEVESRPGNLFSLEFAPLLGAGTRMVQAFVNGQPVEHEVILPEQPMAPNMQVRLLPFQLTGRDVVELEFEPTVEILPPPVESAAGDYDKGLKIIRIAAEEKMLRVAVEGLAGHDYILPITRSNLIARVTGATLDGNRLLICIPGEKARQFVRNELTIQLKR